MPRESTDWDAWLNEHGPGLVLLARQYVPSRADAEDIVQEAFVRCWRSRERAGDVKAYLFGCVRGVALEWLRGRRRRLHRDAVTARPEAEPLFETPAESKERQTLIEQALGELPAEQREVLVLKIWAGLTFEQIGAALAISANTAASRYRYALEKLRAILAEEAVR